METENSIFSLKDGEFLKENIGKIVLKESSIRIFAKSIGEESRLYCLCPKRYE